MGDDFWKTVDQFLLHVFEYERGNKSKTSVNVQHGILKELSCHLSQDGFEALDNVFTPGHPDNVKTEILIRLSEGLYTYASVPAFHGREDCGFDGSDFSGVPERAGGAMSVCTALCKNLTSSHKNKNLYKKPTFSQKFSVHCLLLVAQFSDSDLWNTEEVREVSIKLGDALLDMVHCRTFHELLCDPPDDSLLTSGLFKQVMVEIQPKFQKDCWKQNPTVPRIFFWSISHVKSPFMSDQIKHVLPSSLLLVDDHQPEFKILGIKSLHLLMSECSREELRWHGRSEVIYEVLQHQLYSNEADVLNVTMPALFCVLEINDGIPAKAPPPRIETRYDSILDRLLQSMEMEDKIVIRRAYVQHLPTILRSMGITLCRHIPRLLRIVTNYLEVYDGHTEEARFGALYILQVIIKETWPRIPHHANTILKSLLKLVYDLSTDYTTTPAQVNEDLLSKATEYGKLLRATNRQKVDALLGDVKKIDFNEACAKFAQEVLDDSVS